MTLTTSYNIDYLQFSANDKKYRWLCTDDYDVINPLPYYTQGMRYDNGIRVYTGNVRSLDKSLYVLDGQTCVRNQDILPGLLQAVAKTGNISRMDIAMTSNANLISVAYDNPDLVQVRDKWRDVTAICGADYALETVYYGSLKRRGRSGLARIYDKARELGLDASINLYRAEIELRRDDARIALAMINKGVSLADVLASFFGVAHPKWQSAAGSARPHKLSDYASSQMRDDVEIRRWMWWLLEQVAPTIAKVKYYDHMTGQSNYDRLMRAVETKLRAIKQKNIIK